jgi:hypothetical protein
MQYILLFKGSCAACSKVAGMVTGLSVDNLEARPLESPGVQQLLSDAGLAAPVRPALLLISGDDVRLVSGWQLRRRLAGVLGWRRSGAIARLATAEWRARLARPPEAAGLTRRGALGTGVAGVAAVLLPLRARTAAKAQETTPALAVAAPAEVQRALATAPVRQALETWGPIQPLVHVMTDSNGSALLLAHERAGYYTLVDREDPDNPTAISMGASPNSESLVRFYTVAGQQLADLQAAAGGTVKAVRPADTPDYWLFGACFASCVGSLDLSVSCITNCESCATATTVTGAVYCALCVGCAGINAIRCARQCL